MQADALVAGVNNLAVPLYDQAVAFIDKALTKPVDPPNVPAEEAAAPAGT